MREVRISDHGDWRRIHWSALCAAYGESPFFEYYADDLHPFFERPWHYLLDFNTAITHTLCALIGFKQIYTRLPSIFPHPSTIASA